MPEKKYKSFWQFYPFYLTEHASRKNRALHFVGTALLLVVLVLGLMLKNVWVFAFIPVLGYGFAWVGHYFVEKNRPATFTYPLYSLGADFVMFWHILTWQIDKKLLEAKNTIN